jgi:hypothetical protein
MKTEPSSVLWPFAIIATVLVAACNNASDANNYPALTQTTVPDNTDDEIGTTPVAALPAAPVPDHNYDERRGATYYYIAAVSQDDQKRGVAIGAVSQFQYLGRNSAGEYVLASLNPNGTVSYRAKCSSDCRIIDTDYGGKLAYSASSVIGAAFQDAFRGKLRVADWVKDEAPPTQNVAAAIPTASRAAPSDTSSETPEATDASTNEASLGSPQ